MSNHLISYNSEPKSSRNKFPSLRRNVTGITSSSTNHQFTHSKTSTDLEYESRTQRLFNRSRSQAINELSKRDAI